MTMVDDMMPGGGSLLTAARPAAPSWVSRGGGIALGKGVDRVAAAKRAAEDFESFFVSSMLESMMAGLKPDKLFGGGQGESLYRSMLNQQYGKLIAERDPLGISDMVQREILQLQEKTGS